MKLCYPLGLPLDALTPWAISFMFASLPPIPYFNSKQGKCRSVLLSLCFYKLILYNELWILFVRAMGVTTYDKVAGERRSVPNWHSVKLFHEG